MNWRTTGTEPRYVCLLIGFLVIPAMACDSNSTFPSSASHQQPRTDPAVDDSSAHAQSSAHTSADTAAAKASQNNSDQSKSGGGDDQDIQQDSSQKKTNHGDSTKQQGDSQKKQAPPQSPIDAAIVNLKEQRVRDDMPKVEPAEVNEILQSMVEKSWTRLHPGFELWFDMKNRQVIVGGRISLREGLLEMFACPQGTKEHESIVSTISNAELVHAGLLAIGAIPGKPIVWAEEPVPATGPIVKVTVKWKEGDEVKSLAAQKMVYDESTGKPLAQDWVFCGSGTWTDPDTGRREYFANFGDLICVSSFPTAMMDLPIVSTDANVGLQFSALKDNIPPLGTPVLLVLKPELTSPSTDAKKADKSQNDDKPTAGKQGDAKKAAAEIKESGNKEAEKEAEKQAAPKKELPEKNKKADGDDPEN